jgi:hypothetical protein
VGGFDTTLEPERVVSPRGTRRSRVAVAAVVGTAALLVTGVAVRWSSSTVPPSAPDAGVAVLVESSSIADGSPPREHAASIVTISVRSEPSGAVVLRAADEAWLGQTPISLTLPAAPGEVELVLRLRGYEPERVALRADSDGEIRVALRPLANPSPPPRTTRAPKPPGAAPQPAPPKNVGDGFLDPFGAGH